MPFLTDRAKQLQEIEGHLIVNILNQDSYDSWNTSGSDTSSSDDFNIYSSDSDDEYLMEDSPLTDLLDLYVLGNDMRYFEDRKKCPKSKEFAECFFNNIPSSDFRQLTRMDKHSFWTLVGMIENYPVFHNKALIKQAPVSLQLAATLDRLGHYGNGAGLKRSAMLWGISSGTVVKFMHRCLEALEIALADVVKWPDQNERARISGEFAKLGFPGCVGLVDGTLLFLTQRPKVDGEVYFDRKRHYSLNMQVICDDKKKILHAYTGMPGSCKDVTCLKNSPLWEYRNDYRTFSDGEYLLGDSGYNAIPRVLAAFTYTYGPNQQDREDFNYCVAKTRVANEHCIGILKSRWHSLKESKTQLKGGPSTSVWMIRQIEMCVRLHNFVHNLRDEWTEKDAEIVIENDVVNLSQDMGDVNVPCEAATHLRARIMVDCLEVNRGPGGFLE